MVTLHEVITFLVSMQISISSLQTHNVNRCGRSRHLARKLSLRRKRSSPNVFEMAATETITSLVSWIKHSVDRFVIVSIFIPKLRLILILNSFLGSSDSLVFSELFHSLAPRPLAARSISDFLLTYLAT